jgi:ubiquinone/menaquinone biosynthesis C-methylase UbiE
VASTYRELRLDESSARRATWGHLVRYLSKWIDNTSPVLDVAAGRGDFLLEVSAPARIAVDLDPGVQELSEFGIVTHVCDATRMECVEDSTVGTAMASNFFEHLERDALDMCIDECLRVLQPGGRLIVIQPNFRIAPHHYFDDFTHRTILTHHSLRDLLASRGFEIEVVEPRFLPLTLKSRLRHGHRLLPLYLRLPYRPLASQMLVIARRPEGGR